MVGGQRLLGSRENQLVVLISSLTSRNNFQRWAHQFVGAISWCVLHTGAPIHSGWRGTAAYLKNAGLMFDP
jgi:hypothetical protein